MRVYSYVVARDFGFAPNPFHGYCTLATCRPDIRSYARIGDWIVGTGSATRNDKTKLIYAMKVEEIIDFESYFLDERFQDKKPDLTKSAKFNYGDNIYTKDENGSWVVLDSHHYREGGSKNASNISKDTSEPIVLISQEFIYLGNRSIDIPEDLHFMIKEKQGTRSRFTTEELAKIENWLIEIMKDNKGLKGFPNNWF
ncbi:hypothetical protein R4670_11905 [Acinetobacter baumannii]|uniref:Nmad2 family putative nucleotide modification protein n=1 Tax=Acinetobacter TaxID=469 RepID=UPI00094C9C6D|nr:MULTISPECIES: hypothetical protein [Acinetobacter]MDA3451081.1 hypothetical protein [Acinetobacter sp. AOR43_HL]MDV7619345.1 hypothetical protein [Acinetobacter baumannii]HDQ4283732.1 hypothetical protein [Acinetobacter baumannii]